MIDYEKRRLIRNVLDNPLFDALVEDIRNELAHKMLVTDDNKVREQLFYENKALDSIVGQLMSIANDVRMIDTDAA